MKPIKIKITVHVPEDLDENQIKQNIFDALAEMCYNENDSILNRKNATREILTKQTGDGYTRQNRIKFFFGEFEVLP